MIGPLTASQILGYPVQEEEPSCSFADRCTLQWQDYVMITGIALTIIFFVTALLLGQHLLAAGLGLALPFFAFGEYFICTYADYYDLRQQITGLANVRQELQSEVDVLQSHNEEHAEQNRILSSSNATYIEQNDELRRTTGRLSDIVDGMPQQRQAYEELLRQYGIVQGQIQSETTHLETIRKQMGDQVTLLRTVADELKRHVAQIPSANSLVSLLQNLYNPPL